MTFLKGCIEQIGRIIDDCFYWPWQIHLPPFQAEHFFFLHFFFFFLSPIRVEIYYLILIDGNLSCRSTNFISNRQNTLINKLNSIFIGCNTQPIKNQKTVISTTTKIDYVKYLTMFFDDVLAIHPFLIVLRGNIWSVLLVSPPLILKKFNNLQLRRLISNFSNLKIKKFQYEICHLISHSI